MNSKAKGSAAERELIKILQSHGYDSKRNDQRYVGGMENPDVTLPGVHIECKRTEKLRVYDAMAQAIHDSNGKALPVVMTRKNHSPWLVIMRLDDWIELYRELEGGGLMPRGQNPKSHEAKKEEQPDYAVKYVRSCIESAYEQKMDDELLDRIAESGSRHMLSAVEDVIERSISRILTACENIMREEVLNE